MQVLNTNVALLFFLGASTTALADCVGPDVNQATLDLVKEFEGWYPDICRWTSSQDALS